MLTNRLISFEVKRKMKELIDVIQSIKNRIVNRDMDIDYFDCLRLENYRMIIDGHRNILVCPHSKAIPDVKFSGGGAVVVCDESATISVSLNVKEKGIVIFGESVKLLDSKISCMEKGMLFIDKKVSIINSDIYVGEDANIVISEGVKINKNTVIQAIIGKISIGKETIIGNESEIIGFCEIEIGEKCHFSRDLVIRNHLKSKIRVGDVCLFSWKVTLVSGDGHGIYDLEKKELYNFKEGTMDIEIGEHVWIGNGAMILSKTSILYGSVIAAASLIKGQIPNNVVATGMPLKIIRENVAWGPNAMMDFETFYNTYKNNMCVIDVTNKKNE